MRELLVGRYDPGSAAAFVERAVSRGIAREHYRQTELGPLSSIGLGTYLGDLDPATDTLMTEAIIRTVSEGAVNVIDTAINYRWMASERCVGAGLRSLVESSEVDRRSVLVCTKAGYLTHDPASGERYEEFLVGKVIGTGLARPEEVAAGIHCIAPKYLRWSAKRSLENMGLESIDVFYLHNVAESQAPVFGRAETLRRIEEAFGVLEDLRSDGLIGWYGLATWSSLVVPEDAEEHLELEELTGLARKVAGRSNGFRFVQMPFNALMRGAVESRVQRVSGEPMTPVEAAKSLGLVVVTSAPLLQGKLLRMPELSVSTKGNLTLAQALVQFCRRSPVTTTLVGAKSPEHVRELIDLARIPPTL
ncbi:MAG: aldo/keto reductase [Thaumarchaeota archaeon]|nr:aldo/keto reductase [Candidatus Calditenuaceae archaeon]MDW8043947.1 aldo/keto reductase [Nitrososphaerota archaeon]